MADDETPTNVFHFPGTRRGGDAEGASGGMDVSPGAFIDKYGPGLWKPVASIERAALVSMLYEFQQHKAVADVLITLIETELAYRDKTGRTD